MPVSEGLGAEIRAESEVRELRTALQRAQRQLATAKARTTDLVAATMQGARDAVVSIGAMPTIPAPSKERHRGSPETAVWVLGDWQGAKTTPSYGSEIMRERVHLYAAKALKITEIQRADHPVDECAIVFGGDMIEGLFNFPTQPYEVDSTLFVQWANVSTLLAEVVGTALSHYQSVRVVAEWGNHGRIGSKRDAVPRNDNVDRMCYAHARQILGEQPRLTWDDCPEDIQRLEIGNYRALVIHGDEIGRNGFASPGTIVQHANRWRSGAYPWPFRDIYMHHYHTHAEWPLANGEGSVYQTGSTESDNRYAGVMLASQARPSQRLHFVDPRAGRVTAQYKVWVDDDLAG